MAAGVSLLEKLNPQQREAVENGRRAAADPGRRGQREDARHYLPDRPFDRGDGVMPESILAVTFTNKAAAEMGQRVEKLTGEKSSSPSPCWLHSTRFAYGFCGATSSTCGFLPPRAAHRAQQELRHLRRERSANPS